jgi:hypothetical protein
MQTMAPPEEIPKERAARIDERFDEVNRRIAEGRDEMHRSFDAQANEMRALRQDLSSLHTAVHRGNYTLLAAMLGLIAAILAKGG